jgi:hypothetical protein
LHFRTTVHSRCVRTVHVHTWCVVLVFINANDRRCLRCVSS